MSTISVSRITAAPADKIWGMVGPSGFQEAIGWLTLVGERLASSSVEAACLYSAAGARDLQSTKGLSEFL